MKVLDLFCGFGGWSIPFIEDGGEVVGVDIKKLKYPGELIVQDVKTLDGSRFKGFDLIIGSPPCQDFSNLAYVREIKYGIARDIKRGMETVNHFYRIVKEAAPKFWAMENVRNLERYHEDKPIWRFMISKGGYRTLWGNLKIPLTDDIRFPNKRIEQMHGHNNRSLIPYPIARIVADTVKVGV